MTKQPAFVFGLHLHIEVLRAIMELHEAWERLPRRRNPAEPGADWVTQLEDFGVFGFTQVLGPPQPRMLIE